MSKNTPMREMSLLERLQSEMRDAIEGIAHKEITNALERIRREAEVESLKILRNLVVKATENMGTNEIEFTLKVKR